MIKIYKNHPDTRTYHGLQFTMICTNCGSWWDAAKKETNHKCSEAEMAHNVRNRKRNTRTASNLG